MCRQAIALVAGALLCTGCVAPIVKELAKDHNQNCVIITSVYGTVTMMRVAPGNTFKAAAGNCDIGVPVVASPSSAADMRQLLREDLRDILGAVGDMHMNRVTIPVTVPPMMLTPKPVKP